jgi:ABC-type multidrug transport system ATPase subunit
MIEVVHLHKQFANKQIFHEYNNKFPNAKTCVLGENGLGKTTLFTLIAGLDPYFSGQILLAGKQVNSLQENVALASDKIPFPEFLTAQQILAMTGSAWQCKLPFTLAEEFGFTAFLDTRVSDLPPMAG